MSMMRQACLLLTLPRHSLIEIPQCKKGPTFGGHGVLWFHLQVGRS